MKDRKKTLWILSSLTLILLVIGSTSFHFVGGESAWDSFYITFTILLSHFYHKIELPLSLQLVILLEVFGSFIIIAYVLKLAAEYIF